MANPPQTPPQTPTPKNEITTYDIEPSVIVHENGVDITYDCPLAEDTNCGGYTATGSGKSIFSAGEMAFQDFLTNHANEHHPNANFSVFVRMAEGEGSE